LEISYTESFPRINLQKVAVIILSITCLTVEDLIRRNCALQFTMAQIATSFDDSDATNAFGSTAERLLPRDEECKLQLVIRV